MAISIVRTVIIFLTLMVSMRIMGKRQLGELEPSELVVAVLISDLASHPLQDPGTPLIYGLIPVITLLCCQILISAVIMRSVKMRKIICGNPSFIIKNGRIIEREMRNNRFTLDELREQLRKKDISDISTVQYAILETDGTLSTILYPDAAPATPKQLGIHPEDYSYQMMIVNDGRVLTGNLNAIGFDEKWLQKQLTSQKIYDVKKVFIMTADSNGKIYIAKKGEIH